MILVTGAAGRVGRALIRELLGERKYRGRIRVLVRDVNAARNIFGSKVALFQADLTDPHDFIAIAHALKGADTVVHLAGLADYSASEGELMRANYLGTAQILKAARLSKKRPRIIFISSTSIYRGSGDALIDEDTPPHPINVYGKSKLEAEAAIIASGLDYVILRPPIVYGQGFKEGFGLVIGLLKRGRMPIIGSGGNFIPHIHIDDLVAAIILAINSKLRKEAFIVSSGEMLTQTQCFGIIASEIHVAPPKMHIPKAASYAVIGLAGAFFRLIGKKPKIFKEYVHTLAESRAYSIRKAGRLLRFKPRIKLREGIRDLLRGTED